MISTFILSECCNAPLRSEVAGEEGNDNIVSCLMCDDTIAVVLLEDLILMDSEVTPGDMYRDPNDTGRHHRIDYSKMTVVMPPVPPVWTPPEELIPDDEMRRVIESFESVHSGSVQEFTFSGGEVKAGITPEEDDELTVRLRDAVRQWAEMHFPVVEDEDDTSYRERHHDEPINDSEARHRADDDEEREGANDPGPDTREEPESLSEMDFAHSLARDTAELRLLLRHRWARTDSTLATFWNVSVA